MSRKVPDEPATWTNVVQLPVQRPARMSFGAYEAEPEPGKEGLLYFVAEGLDGNIKIGVSTPSQLLGRVEQMQTGNSQELVVLRVVRLRSPADALAAERRLHLHFARLHVRGEWFRQAGPLKGLRLLDRAFRKVGMRPLKPDGSVWSAPTA